MSIDFWTQDEAAQNQISQEYFGESSCCQAAVLTAFKILGVKNFKFLSNVFDPLINLLILIFGPITSLIRVPKDTKNIIHNNYDSII